MSAASAPPTPWLLRWQGVLRGAPQGPLGSRLAVVSGVVLCALMAGMPLVTRGGLSLLILAAGLLWLVWALCEPAGRIRPISGWLLAMFTLSLSTATARILWRWAKA